MKRLNLLLLFVVLIAYNGGYGQLLRDHEVNEKTIKPWIEKKLEKYEDRYIFQPNDGNYLIIVVDDTNVSAQIYYPSYWAEGGYGLELGLADSSEFKFHSEYITLTGVKISDGKFISDQYKGEFITFKSGKTYKGIKIYNSWSIWPRYKYEIGVKRNENLLKEYKGKYPKASLRILDSAYISTFSKKELSIMRNEIYARYSYKFVDKEWATYFSKQKWYTAHYKSVQPLLTWIELKNIELIKRIEGMK